MANVTHLNDAYAWNITRIADAFSLHRDTVRKRLKESRVRPVSKKSGVDVYALADVGPALFSQDLLAKTDDDIHNPSKMPPKDRKDFFQSERERLKFEEEIGQLIKDSQYRRDLAETLKAVVSYFESMPDKMERLRVFTPAQLDTLETVCDQFRAELYAKVVEVDSSDV